MKIDGDAKTIAGAFVKARKAMNSLVVKDGKGNYGSYPTLAAIVEATTGAFADNGLAIVQETGTDESGVIIETWLVHESGATMHFGSLTMPVGDKRPQTVGSAITYGRRYALAAVCGLAPDDDDDGQAAQNSTRQAPQKAPLPRKAALPQDAPHVDGDALFDPYEGKQPKLMHSRLSTEQAAIIAHLGQKAYPGEWDANMDKLAEWSSKGARSKLGDLYEVEADKLIKALQKKIEQAA